MAQRPCLDATVTVENVRITCTVGPGSGGPYDVFLRISDETDLNTGLRKYNYSVPVVERLEPLNAAPGEVVTIVGDSFGDDISKVAVTVGANACGNLSYAVNHTALLCTTPYQTGEHQPSFQIGQSCWLMPGRRNALREARVQLWCRSPRAPVLPETELEGPAPSETVILC